MGRLVLAAVLAAVAAATSRRRVRVLRFTRVVADLERSEAFYRDGLGMEVAGRGAGDPMLAVRLGVPGAEMHEVALRCGREEVALVRFDPPGAPSPASRRSNDLAFQHLAVVVGDMQAAYDILGHQAPQPISAGGPQTLPARNGGVSAFKFRDPDGHPLELIHFPPGQGRAIWRHAGATPVLGLDHSALAVADTARSVRFYRRLGFHPTTRSLNYGPAQARLDGLPGARLLVTGLRPRSGLGAGLELLAYRPPGQRAAPAPVDGAGAQWVTILAPWLRDAGPKVLRDPDGHLMVLVNPGWAGRRRHGGR